MTKDSDRGTITGRFIGRPEVQDFRPRRVSNYHEQASHAMLDLAAIERQVVEQLTAPNQSIDIYSRWIEKHRPDKIGDKSFRQKVKRAFFMWMYGGRDFDIEKILETTPPQLMKENDNES